MSDKTLIGMDSNRSYELLLFTYFSNVFFIFMTSGQGCCTLVPSLTSAAAAQLVDGLVAQVAGPRLLEHFGAEDMVLRLGVRLQQKTSNS